MNVSEGRSEHEAADWVERFVNLHHVLGRGVELLGREAGGVVTIFFSTDAAGFDFEDDVEFDTFLKEFCRDLHVLIEFHYGAIEHVGLEKGAFALGDALTGSVEKGTEERIYFVRVAVVGVKADEDVVLLSESVDGLSEDDGTKSGVIHTCSGSELPATGGNLDNAIGLGLGECLERATRSGQ